MIFRKRSVGAVIVLKLDRLTRSVGDFSELLKIVARSNSDLVSVNESLDTSSASGRMVVNMLATFAQFEREQIAERTAFALAYKRKEHNVYDPLPFGFVRDGKKLVECPTELPAMQNLIAMRSAGKSYRALGSWLNDAGIKTKRGGKEWYAGTVRRVLTSHMTTELRV